MADIQPLLTDELLTEPTTGRITIRAQDFFEALRVQVNTTADTTDQNTAALIAGVQILVSTVNELTQRVNDLEQLINGS